MLNAELMSKSQRKKMNRKQKCVACSSKLVKSEDDPLADNALSCKDNHQICIECVRDLLQPVDKGRCTEVGLIYTCPVCKSNASIEIWHNLVLVTSSWKKAYGMFENKDHMIDYFNRIASFSKDDETYEENSSETPAETANLQTSLSKLDLTVNTSVNDDSASISTVFQCVVCMTGERSHAMIPCGHKCLCTACATNNVFTDCPICRTPVQSIYEIYE